LNWKRAGVHRFEHPGFLDKLHAVRQQALTDREARELLALEISTS